MTYSEDWSEFLAKRDFSRLHMYWTVPLPFSGGVMVDSVVLTPGPDKPKGKRGTGSYEVVVGTMKLAVPTWGQATGAARLFLRLTGSQSVTITRVK